VKRNDRKAYKTDVKLHCTGDDDWVCVPADVKVGNRGHVPGEICPYCAGGAGDKATGEEQVDHDSLLWLYVEGHDGRDGKGHNDKVCDGIDDACRKQVNGFVDAMLRSDGECPVVRNWAS
jgi:hypothetical protein